jgi:glycosyltransferase involved in cell wall biosynthesis
VRILLIGNYAPDAQESMRRYAELLRDGLAQAGHEVTLALPRAVLNCTGHAAAGVWKWVGYVDKYLLSPPQLGRAARDAQIIHVCDHANSLYVPLRSRVPHIVTCHDMLAIRGALGESTDCPTGFAGRQLQLGILRGLRRAQALACVSQATLRDARALLEGYAGRVIVAPNSLNYPYRVLSPERAAERLEQLPLHDGTSYVLSVGSNLKRKNREGVLRAWASIAHRWGGRLVFAGQPLSAELRSLAGELGLLERVVEVVKPSNELLEALYNRALTLLFPSRFEGFGWPIIEAQACGCPVICADREPMSEVSGQAAVLCDPDDHRALGEAILQLAQTTETREELRRRGLANAQRYDRQRMITQFDALYRELALAA